MSNNQDIDILIALMAKLPGLGPRSARRAVLHLIKKRDIRGNGQICVVEDVSDLWAMERSNVFKGRYHVLGGNLSALDGVGPDELRIPHLVKRVKGENINEIILALNATVDGQTTAHYIADQLDEMDVAVTSLAQGVPIGGELDYLDDGTISAALNARKSV